MDAERAGTRAIICRQNLLHSHARQWLVLHSSICRCQPKVFSIENQKPPLLLSYGCIKAKQRRKGRGIAQTRQACEGTAYTCLRNVSKGMVPNQSKLFNSTGSEMPCSPVWDSNRCSRACMLCTLCSMLSSDSMGRSALLPVCNKLALLLKTTRSAPKLVVETRPRHLPYLQCNVAL